eukprot:3052860-Heterocapsa_arctica.AAC.1
MVLLGVLGGTGPSGRPLAIAIGCATGRCTLFVVANSEPQRSNGSRQNINNYPVRPAVIEIRVWGYSGTGVWARPLAIAVDFLTKR